MHNTMAAVTWLLSMLLVLSSRRSTTLGQLSSDFYEQDCPNVDWIVGVTLKKFVVQEPRMAASIVRLHFHDCFVNGCDASVLLDDTPAVKREKSADGNKNSARGFEVIDAIKEQVEKECPGVVSCADILALAAREAVAMMGGPMWNVVYGRRDSTFASLAAANNDIPPPNSTNSQLIARFAAKGLSVIDLVALSGAHTIGQARCFNFRERLYNFRRTGQSDANLDTNYRSVLVRKCSTSPRSDNVISPLDEYTPTKFDKSYFGNLKANRGLLNSDQVLYSVAGTRKLVNAYSDDEESFQADFAAAMIKMGNIRPLTGSRGQIRRNCRRVGSS